MMMKTLEALSAGISYELIPSGASEKHFHNLMMILARLLVSSNVSVESERHTSDGRMDLLIETPKFIYIIEIKRDKTAEKALQQIKEKNYALQFEMKSKEIYLIGVNFSSEKRRIDGYKIERL